MDPNVLRVKAVLEFFDEQLSTSSFANRLKVQKLVYLAQLTGLDLGYRFSWYKKGPYCSGLADTAYAYSSNQLEYDGVLSKPNLSETGKERLGKLRDILIPPTEWVDRDKEEWLELVASIHFLRHIQYLGNEECVTDSTICDILRTNGKTEFRPEEISMAWSVLKAAGLIDSKVLL